MKRGRGFDRTQRIADLMQKTLAQMLITDMSDERFHLVTITGLSLARDLSTAKVYVSVLMDDPQKIKEVIISLNQAAKPLRYNLAHMIKLRIMPELKFVYDESTARGFHISGLIDSAMKKQK
ncbi:MAG: 30S ribosome-binding factor RbfA [Gammaproteobacteria bacterium]|nr:30S ribosome-binding factor RbfA [Gammaproteobacteria bacterium]